MNYIRLINGFWQVSRERSDFDPYVIALYFALVDIANRRDWKPFTAYREDIIELSGMSAKPYYKSRAILKEAGLIDFKEGASKKIMCSFTINEPLPVVTVAPTVATTVQPTVGTTLPTTEATTILNKPINFKTLKLLNNILLKKESKDFGWFYKLNHCEFLKIKKAPRTRAAAKPKDLRPWANEISFQDKDSPELRTKWQEWINYKLTTPKKKPYTTLRGEQNALNEIGKFPLQFALYCIDLALDKEWVGVVNDGTYQAYQEYANNPSAFLARKGRATLTVTQPETRPQSIKHLDPNAPDYYDRLKEYYAVSKAS